VALTYPEVGATFAGQLPSGYRHIQRTRVLRSDFGVAADALFDWELHRRAGMRMITSPPPPVEVGTRVRMRWGFVTAPCEVVWVVDEPSRRGFAYGTLPGHDESGEESFVLERDGARVVLTVTAFSRPASRRAKLVGPIGRRLQDVMTARYLSALE
jgi:uncharacterized protein (UPF0548 family)